MFPYSQLIASSSSTIALAGPHIQLIANNTGHVLASTTTLQDEAKAAILASGPVRCAAVSTEGDDEQGHLATAGDDKQLKVWQLPALTLLSSRELPKKPTAIAFTRTHDILVADKFGDVFRYPLHPTLAPAPRAPRAPGLASHENPSDGTLVLGHASLLTALLLTSDERHVITADRDEHIRVSWFPQGYNIEMYCLGHKKFVSALHLPPAAPELLVSGGGDDELRVWDWLSGRCVASIPVAVAVLPYAVVRAVRPVEEGDTGKRRGKGKKSKRRKGKADAEEEGEEMVVGGEKEVDEKEEVAEQKQEPELIFAVQKIATVSSGDRVHIIFSAIGATALFSVGMPSTGVSTSVVHALNLGKPVLDFSIVGESILVSVDATWGESGGAMVRAVKVTTKGELVYSDDHATLVGSLNGGTLIPATSAELEALDLYAELSALPKHTDAPAAATPVAEEGANKKQLGRMKNKQRVLEQLEERDMKRARSD
ncbi:WD40-repeat-containing domain protein [Infundibulicybe gibba]|nr:WD40-repeat-containing domain protein [Infundibulicybe gibba]